MFCNRKRAKEGSQEKKAGVGIVRPGGRPSLPPPPPIKGAADKPGENRVHMENP